MTAFHPASPASSPAEGVYAPGEDAAVAPAAAEDAVVAVRVHPRAATGAVLAGVSLPLAVVLGVGISPAGTLGAVLSIPPALLAGVGTWQVVRAGFARRRVVLRATAGGLEVRTLPTWARRERTSVEAWGDVDGLEVMAGPDGVPDRVRIAPRAGGAPSTVVEQGPGNGAAFDAFLAAARAALAHRAARSEALSAAAAVRAHRGDVGLASAGALTFGGLAVASLLRHLDAPTPEGRTTVSVLAALAVAALAALVHLRRRRPPVLPDPSAAPSP